MLRCWLTLAFRSRLCAPFDFDNLWMSQPMGKVLYLTLEFGELAPMIPHLGGKQAAPLEQYKPRTRISSVSAHDRRD